MSTPEFTHFNDQGRARMVDVGEKQITQRTATAAARVLVNRTTFDLIRSGGVKKGDVLTVAQIAGIMAGKRTPDLIPMCHPVPLNGIDLIARDAIVKSILEVAERDTLLLVSSHMVEELETFADRAVFMKHGKLILTTGIRELSDREGKTIVEKYREIYGHTGGDESK